MTKFNRNFIIIFGFILIVNFLFFPCNLIDYSIKFSAEKTPAVTKSRRVSADYWKVFFPLIKSRANKYKEYVKWESSVFLTLEKEAKALKKKYALVKPQYTLEELELRNVRYRLERDERIILEKYYYNEFFEKFGYYPYYHQIKIEFFFVELVLLIFIGLLCNVFIRKIKKWTSDRIKRRKFGIILGLIGVGVLAALLPLSISAGDDTGITILSIAGITFILVGIGMVIFSFLPEDAKPKK